MKDTRNSRRIKLRGKIVKLDSFMYHIILAINRAGFKTLSCCSGHGIYQPTIIFEDSIDNKTYEFVSNTEIPRKRRFYLKNKKNGLYYIPEVSGKSGELTIG